jgi:hypothetical protein
LSTPIPRLPFPPVADIADINTHKIDVREIDGVMYRVLLDTRFTLLHAENLKKHTYYDKELLSFLKGQLALFATTYKTIRIILRNVYRKREYPSVADAASLAREQVEKVFVVAIALDNPKKWIRQYLRNSWRSDYETYLLRMEEHGALDRHQEHLQERYPEYLERGQRPPIGRGETIVSNVAKRVVLFNWNNPGTKKPKWLKRRGSVADYLRDYFEFPTPGKAARKFRDRKLRRFLFRWHREYARLSEYTHVALGKSVLPTMSELKDWESSEKTERYGKKLSEEIIFTSYCAAASACALVLNAVDNNYGAKNQLRDFWTQLYDSSLLARPFWDMYIKDILK